VSRFVRYQLPAILWAALILSASTASFSSQNSGHWLRELIIRLLGHPIAPHTFDVLHFLARKTAHVVEYGILGALTFRALRRGAATRWMLRWALTAVLLSTAVAGLDEWRQSFVPSRTATPRDVALDAFAAAGAQVLIRAAQMLF
jgi:VanZ family protein